MYRWLLWYLLAINLAAALLTVVDKSRAKRGRWRIPEATLLTVAALGGAPLMLFTMKKIRHKTRHRRFMVGLPVMIAVQAAVVVFLLIHKFQLF